MMANAPVAWEVARPMVVVAGSGMWAEILTRLISRCGGASHLVRTRDEILALDAVSHASAVVAGPPLTPAELVEVATALRDGPTPFIAVIDGSAPADLETDLRIVGAAGVAPVDEDLREVTKTLLSLSRLPLRRSSRGVLLAPVLLRTGRTLHAAIASDVSEGGLGIEGAVADLAGGIEEVQFQLPGAAQPITVATRPAWTEAGRVRVRVGLRFLDLDPVDRAAIRTYLGLSEALLQDSPGSMI